ncbi:MAG TPA: Vms1/Ankzf1 family peptidyl-tRNA hydrolase [Thermomicrobiales bacterium]|nr:Vms1/Ankzf1 family peptidyl-tRNA hydrolase [Thermomicrobiales bacterium]
MATDPVQEVNEFQRQTDLATNVPQLLSRLAQLPPSTDAPYLTITLDWRPEGMQPGRRPAPEIRASDRRGGHEKPHPGPSWRPSWEEMHRDLADLVDSYEPHTPAHDSLAGDLDKFADFAKEIDEDAYGVLIVACSARNIFRTVPIGLPLPTRYHVGPTPALLDLATAADDHPTYAALVADQKEATLYIIDWSEITGGVALESSGYPAHQKAGGWSNRRYQDRADERVDAFAREIAEQVHRVMTEQGIERLIVAADEPIRTALADAFPESVKGCLIDTINISTEANEESVIDQTLPIIDHDERKREDDAVENVRNNHGPGGTSVIGAQDTLTALQGGQVMSLVMNDDFSDKGWADFVQEVYGVGKPPKEHPYGGDVKNIVPVDLNQQFVRLALQNDAEVQVVKTEVPVSVDEQVNIPDAGEPRPRAAAAKTLDEMGGVGAILRFPVSAYQSTADLK